MSKLMNNLEDFVRNCFDEINSLTLTNNTDEYSEDYLHLFNSVTSEENQEIHKLLSNIMVSLQRLQEIQDDCYGR